MTSRQTVDAPGAPAAVGPYVHAVKAAGLLFCSGQIPLDPATGEIAGETPAEQARRCLQNLQAVCVAAGTSLDAAVKMTVYLTDMAAFRGGQRRLRDVLPARAAGPGRDRGGGTAPRGRGRDRRGGRTC